MVNDMKIIIKDKILHPIIELWFHYPQIVIIFAVDIWQKNYYFVVTIQPLSIILGVLFELALW